MILFLAYKRGTMDRCPAVCLFECMCISVLVPTLPARLSVCLLCISALSALAVCLLTHSLITWWPFIPTRIIWEKSPWAGLQDFPAKDRSHGRIWIWIWIWFDRTDWSIEWMHAWMHGCMHACVHPRIHACMVNPRCVYSKGYQRVF